MNLNDRRERIAQIEADQQSKKPCLPCVGVAFGASGYGSSGVGLRSAGAIGASAGQGRVDAGAEAPVEGIVEVAAGDPVG